FFAAPIWTPALVFVPWLSPRYRFPLVALLLVLAATLFYPFSFSHYYGPVACVFVLIVLAGLKRMRTISVRGKPFGAAFCSLLIIISTGTFIAYAGWDLYARQFLNQPKNARSQLIDYLTDMGGQHVVFVSYSLDHDFNYEYVYNAADIDSSNIVWARD